MVRKPISAGTAIGVKVEREKNKHKAIKERQLYNKPGKLKLLMVKRRISLSMLGSEPQEPSQYLCIQRLSIFSYWLVYKYITRLKQRLLLKILTPIEAKKLNLRLSVYLLTISM